MERITDYSSLSLGDLQRLAYVRGVPSTGASLEIINSLLRKDVSELTAKLKEATSTPRTQDYKLSSLSYIKARFVGASFPIASTVKKGHVDISGLTHGGESKVLSKISEIVVGNHYITYVRKHIPNRGEEEYVRCENIPTLLWLAEEGDEVMFDLVLKGLGITNLTAGIEVKLDLIYLFMVTSVRMIFEPKDLVYISSLGVDDLGKILGDQYPGPWYHAAMLFSVLTGFSISPNLKEGIDTDYINICKKPHSTVIFLATYLYRCMDGPTLVPPYILQGRGKHRLADVLEIYYGCKLPIGEIAAGTGVVFPSFITSLTDCSNARNLASNNYYISNILKYEKYITRPVVSRLPAHFSQFLSSDLLSLYSDKELLDAYPLKDEWKSRDEIISLISSLYSSVWYMRSDDPHHIYHGPMHEAVESGRVDSSREGGKKMNGTTGKVEGSDVSKGTKEMKSEGGVTTEGTPSRGITSRSGSSVRGDLMSKKYTIRGLDLSFKSEFFVNNRRDSDGMFTPQVISDLRTFITSIPSHLRTKDLASLLSIIDWLNGQKGHNPYNIEEKKKKTSISASTTPSRGISVDKKDDYTSVTEMISSIMKGERYSPEQIKMLIELCEAHLEDSDEDSDFPEDESYVKTPPRSSKKETTDDKAIPRMKPEELLPKVDEEIRSGEKVENILHLTTNPWTNMNKTMTTEMSASTVSTEKSLDMGVPVLVEENPISTSLG